MKSYVIGMGIEEEDFASLEVHGEFMNIENPSEVDAILDLTLKKVFNSTTVRVDLLDQQKKATETDVPMTFTTRHRYKPSISSTIPSIRKDNRIPWPGSEPAV